MMSILVDGRLFDADQRVVNTNDRMWDFSRAVSLGALMAENRRTR